MAGTIYWGVKFHDWQDGKQADTLKRYSRTARIKKLESVISAPNDFGRAVCHSQQQQQQQLRSDA
jgi:hypothetical protein